MEVTWELDVINAAAADGRNVALPILKCKYNGFAEDVSEYRAWAVKRTQDNASITATVPSAGTFYPAFIFYDSAGDERIAISINGKHVGTAVADADDNRQKLYFLSEPRTFQGGETIELKALTGSGQYKTEDLLLLREKPQSKQPVYQITGLGVRANENSASISWLTSWPAASEVETDDPSVKAREELALNNHRVQFNNLAAGRTYKYRVTARSRDGKVIATDWQTFRTEPHPTVTGSARRERLALKFEKGVLPVTAGIPFAKGVLGSDNHLRAVDAGGAELPLQTRVLQHWPDGSVKWVLLDLGAGIPAATVEYGTEVNRTASRSPLKLTEDNDAVTVDTGTLKFTVNKRRFGLLDSVWRNGEKVVDKPAEFSLTGPDGAIYSSLAAPDEVKVEEIGPVRALVRVSGRHQTADGKKLFRYVVRIHAWAGQPYVRIQHTFENDHTATDFIDIRSLILRVPVAGEARKWALAGTSGLFSKTTAAATLQQHTDDRFTLQPVGVQGKRAPGIAEWNDGAHSVTLAVRDFWQTYPKDLRVRPDGFELALLPGLRPDEYDSANGTIDEHRIYYYLHGGAYKLRQGMTKTHDLWLEFDSPPSQASIRGEQQVRMAAASPDWYEQSKVFGELSVPRASPVLRQYDDLFTQTFAGYLRDREGSREYGLLNFGDWWGERIINWGNSEYDTQHAFLLQFARTADWRYFRAAEEMEWHNRDIDAIHYHADPIQVGAVYAHAIGHSGDYYKARPTAGAPPGGFTAGSPKSHFAADHTFIEGHFDYYFLTGDDRSFQTALRTADRYDSYFTKNYDFNNCRQPGWHLILTMAAYNATNDPYYLNAAKMIVERVLERQTPDGGWKRQMVPGHCFCTPRHQGNAGFMVGVLLTGLRHYYEATGDERAAESIVKGARFLVNDMWIQGVKGFRYTSCPKSSSGSWSNFLLFDGLVFAHRRTNDPRLREVLLIGTDGALETMTEAGKRDGAAWGKGFTQYTRVVPHFLDHLASLKEKGRMPRKTD
ncbi:MAG: glycoside hydrolase family 127 protein [Bryobacterales bacterium]|nr:glycoside hydrolase family 127 protein [Bryobacterales bacterium]